MLRFTFALIIAAAGVSGTAAHTWVQTPFSSGFPIDVGNGATLHDIEKKICAQQRIPNGWLRFSCAGRPLDPSTQLRQQARDYLMPFTQFALL